LGLVGRTSYFLHFTENQ